MYENGEVCREIDDKMLLERYNKNEHEWGITYGYKYCSWTAVNIDTMVINPQYGIDLSAVNKDLNLTGNKPQNNPALLYVSSENVFYFERNCGGLQADIHTVTCYTETKSPVYAHTQHSEVRICFNWSKRYNNKNYICVSSSKKKSNK